MQKIGFAEALDSIVASDPRYQRDAYVFLRDALDYTTKQQKKTKGASVRHVAGPELLGGVRQYAPKEFGPMVVTVLSYWGIRSTEDIGHMVFNLIGAGIFGKTEEDPIEDCKIVFDSQEAWTRTNISARVCRTSWSTCCSRERKQIRRMRSRRKSKTWAVTSTPIRRSIAPFSGSTCRRTGPASRSKCFPTR